MKKKNIGGEKMCGKRVERQKKKKGLSININADILTVTLVG